MGFIWSAPGLYIYIYRYIYISLSIYISLLLPQRLVAEGAFTRRVSLTKLPLQSFIYKNKNIPEELTAIIYKNLQEKNKKRKEYFEHNDNIKGKLTTNLKENQISIKE